MTQRTGAGIRGDATPNKNPPILWVRTAAGPQLGFGHLGRCVTLTRLLSADVRPVYLTDCDDPWTVAAARHAGWQCTAFSPRRIWEEASPPALILLDTRKEEGASDLVAGAARRGIVTVSIHDLGLSLLDADIVIDGSLCPAPRARIRPGAHYLSGPDYLVLDPAFARVHGIPRRVGSRTDSVFVCLGGGADRGYLARVLGGLKLWAQAREVVGMAGFVRTGSDEPVSADILPAGFRWAGADETVPELISQADVAITAGGLSAFEALCAGAPLLALSYDQHQRRTVAALTDAGVCADLGAGDSLKPETVAAELEKLAGDPGRREAMSARGREIVDGRGAERVAEIMRHAIPPDRLAPRQMVANEGAAVRP